MEQAILSALQMAAWWVQATVKPLDFWLGIDLVSESETQMVK